MEGSPQRKHRSILWNVLNLHALATIPRDRTTPPNWPWSTRNICNVATHQYISLNNSGILSFPVPATLVHCVFNWSLILLFVHQLLLGKKPNNVEKHYPRTCILQGALPHTALSSPCSFPNVISFSYNLFSKKIWPLQKGFVNRSAIMELIICFHVRNAAEAQTLYGHWFGQQESRSWHCPSL